jgi:SEC-C motif-containing protein
VVYAKCCGRFHRHGRGGTRDNRSSACGDALLLLKSARPSEVVRARYTAYAKRVVDFIVASTHPDNPNYVRDVEHWKRTIESNSYDDFLLNQCVILEEEEISETVAKVKFLAKMTHRETGERTAFVETSTFERDPETGAWLYREGVIASPDDGDLSEVSK